MHIKIDKNYSIEPDGFKGVVLIHEYSKEVKKKDGKVVTQDFSDKWYYPSPDQALRKWMELTSAEVNLESVENFLKDISEKLDKVYEGFKNNNWLRKDAN